MKTLLKVLCVVALTVLMAIAATAKNTEREKPSKNEDRNLFVVKVDKSLLGAKVEIIQHSGTVIAEQLLRKRKLVIDFNESTSGFYRIRIMKGKKIKEYYYHKV